MDAAAGRCVNRFYGSKKGLSFSIFNYPLSIKRPLFNALFVHDNICLHFQPVSWRYGLFFGGVRNAPYLGGACKYQTGEVFTGFVSASRLDLTRSFDTTLVFMFNVIRVVFLKGCSIIKRGLAIHQTSCALVSFCGTWYDKRTGASGPCGIGAAKSSLRNEVVQWIITS